VGIYQHHLLLEMIVLPLQHLIRHDQQVLVFCGSHVLYGDVLMGVFVVHFLVGVVEFLGQVLVKVEIVKFLCL
jgi:hypothetical protein